MMVSKKKWWLDDNKKLIVLIVSLVVIIVVFVFLCVLFLKKKNVMVVSPECKNAVQEYLANADMEWAWQQVQKWDEVVVDYIWRLADGTVFDTSVESVAIACESYNAARDYDAWLAFTVWAWQMIAGFDRGVEWMKIWQTKTIEIAAWDAYWEWDESLVISVDKADLENPGQYEKWQVLYTQYWQKFKIYKITKDKIYLDTNHELAWKKLIFDITVKEIK